MTPGPFDWAIDETVAPIIANRRGLGWRWQLFCFSRWLLAWLPK